MHAIYSRTQNNIYTKMNLSAVKWAQRDKTQSRELLDLFICVCSSLCTIVAQNIAQNRPDNFPSYSPDKHHCSNDVYLRERGIIVLWYQACTVLRSPSLRPNAAKDDDSESGQGASLPQSPVTVESDNNDGSSFQSEKRSPLR